MNKTRCFHYQDREYHLRADIHPCGEDYCILISGGDRPHIGAAALGVAAGSANHPEKITATPSVLSVPGHKEHLLALDAAERLSKTLATTVVVTVGIHIKDITPGLIDQVVEEFNGLIDDLAEALGKK